MNALHRYIVELRIYSGVNRGWCWGVAFKLSGFVRGRQYTATTITTLFFLHLCHYHFPFFRPIFCLVVFRALCAKTMNQCSATLLFYVCGASLIGFSCSWIQLTFSPFPAAVLLFYISKRKGKIESLLDWYLVPTQKFGLQVSWKLGGEGFQLPFYPLWSKELSLVKF